MSKSQIVKEMNEASGSGTQTHLQATVPETQTHLQETPKQVSNTASLVTCNSSSDSDEDYDEPYDQNAYRVNVRQNNPPVENFLIQKTKAKKEKKPPKNKVEKWQFKKSNKFRYNERRNVH